MRSEVTMHLAIDGKGFKKAQETRNEGRALQGSGMSS
jgi:hypothetical protein